MIDILFDFKLLTKNADVGKKNIMLIYSFSLTTSFMPGVMSPCPLSFILPKAHMKQEVNSSTETKE